MSHRLLAWGWMVALGLGLASTAFAAEVVGRYGGGRIVVRPWMEGYNLAVNLTQLLVFALLIVGVSRLPSGRARKLAVAAFSAAALAVLAMLLFPQAWGGGPWTPDAAEVRALSALVFVPSLLRALGLAAAATAILRDPRLVLSLLGVDVALVAWKWLDTPSAVMACVHPFCAAPLGLLPWTAATATFLWLSRRGASFART